MIKNSLRVGIEVAQKSWALVLTLWVLNVVYNLIHFVFPTTNSGHPSTGFLLWMIVQGVLLAIVGLFVHGGALGFVRDEILEKKPTFSTIISSGFTYFWRFVAVFLLLAFSFVAIVLLLLLLSVSLDHFHFSHHASSIITTILMIIAGGVALYLAVVGIFSPYFIVLKECGAIQALRQSLSTIGKHLGAICLLLLLFIGLGIIGSSLAFLGAALINHPLLEIGYVLLWALIAAYLNVFFIGVVMSLCRAFLHQEQH